MRSICRTLGPELTRDIALVCAADAVVGASFGAIATSSGFAAWVPMLLSVAVFAGSSQFMLIGIVASGGSLLAAVTAGLLANGRHLPFGFAVGDLLEGPTWRRLLGTHLMVDESVAFALNQSDPRRRRVAYWACGAALFVCWNLAVAVGAAAGRVIGDTDALGLDAAFPAVLLALVLPALRADAATRHAAVAGAVIALATSWFLPAGLPVLLALLGLLVTRRLRPARPARTTPATRPTSAGSPQETP